MSMPPSPPGRSEPNHNVSPSREIAELVSNEGELAADTSVGAPNGAAADARRAVQTSVLTLSRFDGEEDLQEIAGQRRVVAGLRPQLGPLDGLAEPVRTWRFFAEVHGRAREHAPSAAAASRAAARMRRVSFGRASSVVAVIGRACSGAKASRFVRRC